MISLVPRLILVKTVYKIHFSVLYFLFPRHHVRSIRINRSFLCSNPPKSIPPEIFSKVVLPPKFPFRCRIQNRKDFLAESRDLALRSHSESLQSMRTLWLHDQKRRPMLCFHRKQLAASCSFSGKIFLTLRTTAAP